MTTLPPIAESPGLAKALPSYLDASHYRFVPHNPDRYAISLLTGEVWDLYRSCFLKTQYDGKGRRYFRLVHPSAEPRNIYASRVMALIVCGPPPSPTAQAHHRDENPTGPNADRWDNIEWQTPAQNLARSQKHQAAKRRVGEDNGRTALCDENLVLLIRLYETSLRKGRAFDWDMNALWAGVTERQLRRIIAGKSRGDRVAEIRRQIDEENKNGSGAKD
jgi:hypothetical protein